MGNHGGVSTSQMVGIVIMVILIILGLMWMLNWKNQGLTLLCDMPIMHVAGAC